MWGKTRVATAMAMVHAVEDENDELRAALRSANSQLQAAEQRREMSTEMLQDHFILWDQERKEAEEKIASLERELEVTLRELIQKSIPHKTNEMVRQDAIQEFVDLVKRNAGPEVDPIEFREIIQNYVWEQTA